MRKHKKEGRADLREVVCRALDITPDTLPGAGAVEIRGRNSVAVREGGRIIIYTPELVSMELNGGIVNIHGVRLICTGYCRGAVRIDGLIKSVDFGEET